MRECGRCDRRFFSVSRARGFAALMMGVGIGVGYSLKPYIDARLFEQSQEIPGMYASGAGVMIPDGDLSALLNPEGLRLASSALVRDRDPAPKDRELVANLIDGIGDKRSRDQAYTDATLIAVRQMRGWQCVAGTFLPKVSDQSVLTSTIGNPVLGVPPLQAESFAAMVISPGKAESWVKAMSQQAVESQSLF